MSRQNSSTKSTVAKQSSTTLIRVYFLYTSVSPNENKIPMNKRKTIILNIFILISTYLSAQDITMDRGGMNHSGEYNTKTLKSFSKVKWKTKLDANGSEAFIFKNDTIYVSAGKGSHSDSIRTGYFYAISAKKGNIIWKDSVNQLVSYPTLKDSILYYGSDDKPCKIRAINKNTGKLIWDFPLNKHSCWAPALYKNKAFFGDHNGNFFVVNNNTGKELFKQNINAGICCIPSIVDSIVYYMDLKGGLHSFNSNSFTDSIIYNTGSGLNNPPVIVNNIAYVASGDGSMYAISLDSNKLIWSTKIDDSMYRSPAVSKDVITVITSNSYIYAFNIHNGNEIWKIKKQGLGYTNTTIVQNTVYVGCPDNYLYAYDLHTGIELWKFQADAPVKTPFVNKGIVYFTSGNYLYAIE